MRGGYYLFEHQGFTFISVNTLLWDTSVLTEALEGEDERMMEIINEILTRSENSSVVLFFHYFPGINSVNGGGGYSVPLKDEYISKFSDLILNHSSKIAFLLGAHLHNT
jgi:hypothetical protein